MKNLIPNSEPQISHRKVLYKLYEAIYDCEIENKRKNLLTYLFAWEDWSWRIEGISKNALILLKEKDFFPKPKGLVRHHFKQNRSKTYEQMLQKKYNLDEWWNLFWENDSTWLITEEEHKNVNKFNYDLKNKIEKINWADGYFKGGGLVGFKYRKSVEAKMVELLYESKVKKLNKINT